MARDSSRRRGTQRPDFVAVEQLVIAEHDDAGLDQAEAGADAAEQQREARSRGGGCVPTEPIDPRSARSSMRRQPRAFRLVVAGDQDLLVAAATLASSSRQLGDLPLKRSTDSTRRWQVASTVGPGKADSRTLGKRKSCWKMPSTENRPRRVVHPLQEVLALLVQVVRLEQDDPGAGRQVVAEVARRPGARSRAMRRARSVPWIEALPGCAASAARRRGSIRSRRRRTRGGKARRRRGRRRRGCRRGG